MLIFFVLLLRYCKRKQDPDHTAHPVLKKQKNLGCWISTRHLGAQLAGEYLWMWIAAFISLILYFPLYFCLVGYIEVDVERWWSIRLSTTAEVRKPPAKKAYLMLLFVFFVFSYFPFSISHHFHLPLQNKKRTFLTFTSPYRYPVSYVILVLPDSICRWMEFRNQLQIPSAAILFSTSIFGLSGLVNVVLLLYTRSGI